MSKLVDFLDDFQQRVNQTYAAKFFLDEAQAAGQSAKRTPGELDKEKVYLTLALAHDRVREMPFSNILDKGFVAQALTPIPNNPLRPFYNQATRLAFGMGSELPEYLAYHLVSDVNQPVAVSGANGAVSTLHHAAITDPKDMDIVRKDVQKVFERHPYLTFLYVLSLCEIYLPKPETPLNGAS